MRVDKSDLDDTVVEDGETAIIPKSETKSAATRTQDVNGVHLKRASLEAADKPQNGVMTQLPKKREPVEDTDAGDMKNGSEKEVDALTATLGSCNISAADHESGADDLEKHMAGLKVKDEDGEENENETESTDSVIVVGPPSLTQEEDEERCESSGSSDLEARGPTAGKPAAFQPGNDICNRIAGKGYYTHNFDKYMSGPSVQPQQFLPQQQMQQIYDFAPSMDGSFPQFGMVSQANDYGFNAGSNIMASGGGYSGKRQMDDDSNPYFKFTRPMEENNYMPQQQNLNDLNMGGSTSRPYMSIGLGSGGQVIDNSPEIMSPTSELNGLQFTPKFDSQFSLGDVDSMLEVLQAQEQSQPPSQLQQKPQMASGQGSEPVRAEYNYQKQALQQNGLDFDPGYTSENSPHSENMGSPGSSPKSAFSPQRPPSNMSGDSGIASPFSEDSMHSVMPSPASDHMMQGGGRNTASPGSVAASSQPPSVGPWPPVTDEYTGQYGGMVGTPHSAYMSPASVGSDDQSLLSAADDGEFLNTYFKEHRDDLKDALEVVASDMFRTESKKKMISQKTMNVNNMTMNGIPPHPNGVLPQQVNNMPHVMPSQIPQATTHQVPQTDARPNKLPIPALPKANTAANIAQKPVTTASSVPLVVVPNTMAPQGQPVTSVAPVTSSQPLLMIPPGQPGQQIIVLVNSQPQPEKKKAPMYKPIRPKIPPSNPPTVACDPNLSTKTEVTAAKVGPIMHSAPDTGSSCAGTNRSPGGQAAPCMQQPTAPPSGDSQAAQNRNGSQLKMLNIARRLVASMTKEDLQFKDNEGDTYLHVSVCKADRNMVQALLERMTRENLTSMINAQNSMRQTPLYLAVSSNHPEMVELLIQYGADVNHFAEHMQADGRSKEVKAALHSAATNGAQYLATLQALLTARELMIDLVNSDGHTALHCAILEHGKQRAGNEFVDNLPIIQALIRHGADPNAQGKKSGKTALMYALESRNIALIEHVVTLIDPSRLRTFLKTPAFDGSTCLRIMENVQRDLIPEHRQRLQACLKMNGSR